MLPAQLNRMPRSMEDPRTVGQPNQAVGLLHRLDAIRAEEFSIHVEESRLPLSRVILIFNDSRRSHEQAGTDPDQVAISSLFRQARRIGVGCFDLDATGASVSVKDVHPWAGPK
jgi:hypothetical protein